LRARWKAVICMLQFKIDLDFVVFVKLVFSM
jgi:hypothetical protein